MDRRSQSNSTFTDNATITFSDDITIKGVIIDASACGSNTYYAYFDNMKLFSVGATAGSHNYSIKAVAGGSTIKTFAGGTVAEGETYSVYVPKAIVSNGQYYVLDDADNANLTGYYASYTMGTSGDEMKEINYTLNPNVVYYGDWETAYSTTSTNYGVESGKTALSQGQGRTIKRTDYTMNLSFTAPVAGKYQIEIPYLNPADKDRTHIIYLDGTEDANKLEEKSVAKNGGYGTYSGEVELTAGSHTIYVKCTYNLTAAMDYLMVTLNEITGTIASSGYSSLASAYALDFEHATGLTVAYVVSDITNTSVKLTSVDELPANSGVILKGEGGASYSIPVKASATFSGTNKLQAAVTAYDCAANEVYILKDGLFHLVTATSTVPAGRAYLLAEDVPTAARSLTFAYEDETTTGIMGNNRESITNNRYYNMNGQLVNQPTKGLYIVNGKKVIIK